MSIELLTLSGSPFGWKVQLALGHLGVAHATTMLSADRGDLRRPEFLALNPHGKLPVLLDGSTTLYESDVIVEYLEDAFADSSNRLWPASPVARAMARRVAAESSAYLYPPIRWLVTHWMLQPNASLDRAALDDSKRAIGTQMAAFATVVDAGFIVSDSPGAADYAIYPLVALLQRLDARRPGESLTALVPDTLLAWSRRIEALDFFARTYPPHWTT